MDSPGVMNLRIFCLTFPIVAILLGLGPGPVTSFDARCFRSHWDHDVIILPHPDDCTKFLKCDQNYEAIEKSCPPSLEFDPTLKICDWPKGLCAPKSRKPVNNVMSCNGLTDNAYQPDYEDNCRSFYYCTNGVARTARCIPQTRFDIISQKCIDEQLVKCELPSETVIRTSSETNCLLSAQNASYYIANIQDQCKSFYHCINGELVREYCEGTQIFNIHTKSCDWPQKVVCGEIHEKDDTEHQPDILIEEKVFDDVDCHQYPQGLIVGPNVRADCVSYFVCRNSELVEDFCAEPLLFNAALGVCDYRENVEECLVSNDRSHIINCEADNKTIYKHPYDCSSFIRCNYGRSQISTCPLGHMFDEDEMKCVKDPDVTCRAAYIKKSSPSSYQVSVDIPLDTNKVFMSPNYANLCQSYFSCENGYCREEFCHEGTLFDSITLTCFANAYCHKNHTTAPIQARAVPSNIECSMNRNQGKWYSDEEDCTKFYVCANGNAYRQQCHAGQYFDQVRGICLSGFTETCRPSARPEPLVAVSESGGSCGKYKDGDKIPDLFDPKKYYVCSNGVLESESCPEGCRFSTISFICVIDSTATTTTTTTTTTTSTTTTSTQTPPGECKVCGYLCAGDPISNMFNNRTFYVCQADGHLKLVSCGKNELFNGDYCDGVVATEPPEETTTTPEETTTTMAPEEKCTVEGEFKPDYTNPKNYYVCANGIWNQKTCLVDQVFEPVLLMCVLDTEVTTPTTTTLAPEEKCTTEGEFRPDYNNAKNYYVCANGIWNQKNCLIDQVFDPVQLMCVLDTEVTTPTTTTLAPEEKCTIEGEFMPDYNNTKNYYVCANGIWNQKTCLVDQVFDAVLLMCVPDTDVTTTTSPTTEAPQKLCNDGKLLPNYFNNTNFYVCVNEVWNEATCPAGLVFDPTVLWCVTKPGETTTTQIPEKDCGLLNAGGRLPDAFDNTKYYVCMDGYLRQRSCQEDYYFDAQLLECVTDTPTTTIVPKNCGTIPEGGLYPDDTENNKYYVCVDGVLIPKICPAGSTFSSQTLQCSLTTTPEPSINCGSTPDGTIEADPLDDTKYYVCVHGDLQHLSCPKEYYFDASELQCLSTIPTTTPVNRNCGSTPDGDVIADPSNVNSFYVCLNGSLYHRNCPVESYFDATIMQCESTVSTTTAEYLDCGSTPNGGFLPDESSNTIFYVCINGTLNQRSCPENWYFDKNSLMCVSTGPTTTQQDDSCGQVSAGAFIPDEFNDRKFYVCVAGMLRHVSCPENQIFDKITLMCVANSATTSTTTTTTTTEAPPGSKDCGPNLLNGEFLPDMFNETNYYVCAEGVLQHRACPEGMIFDAESLMCAATMTSSTTTTSTTESSTTTSTTPSVDLDCGPYLLNGEFLPDVFNETNYYVCAEGVLQHHACPEGMIFDSESLMCAATTTSSTTTTSTTTTSTTESSTTTTSTTPSVDLDCGPYLSNGEFLPDVFNETNYFVCAEGVLQHQTCPAGMIFDSESLMCVASTTSSTTTTSTTESSTTTTSTTPSIDLNCGDIPNGNITTDPSDCKLYLLCVDGELESRQCEQVTESENPQGPCECLIEPPKNCGDIPHGNITADPNDCKLYLLCVDGELESRTCEKVTETENPQGPCECLIETEKSCGDIPHGNITADPNDCKSYLICVNGELESRQCEQVTETENPQGPCECLIIPPKNCGDIPHGNITADPNDCKLYLLCVDGELESKTCEQVTETDDPQGPCECLIEPPKCDEIGKLYPDVLNNTCYYICMPGGVLVHYACPEGMEFVNDGCKFVGASETEPTPIGTANCGTLPTGSIIADIFNKDKYYVCVDGSLNQLSCSEGMAFDPTLSSCAVESLTSTTTIATPEPTTTKPDPTNCGDFPNGSLIPDAGDRTKYYVCVNGNMNLQSCDVGWVFEPELLMCIVQEATTASPTTTSSGNCDEYPNGSIVANSKDDTKFYVCVNGEFVQKSCDAGWIFDATLLMCVNVETTTPSTSTQNSCNCGTVSDGGFLPDLFDDKRFYVCICGTLRHIACPAGQTFEKDLSMCVGATTTTTTEPTTLNCGSTAEGSRVPDPFDTTQFYVCVQGVLRRQSCPSGETFETNGLQCTIAGATVSQRSCGSIQNGGQLADEFNTRAFYVCINGILRRFMCDADSVFDKTTLECRTSTSSSIETTTESITIPTTQSPTTETADGEKNCGPLRHGQILPDTDNINKFYVCVDGILNLETCPTGWLFDQVNLYCYNCSTGDGSTTTESGGATTTVATDKGCGNIKNGGFVDDKTDDTKFFVCVNGELNAMKCGNGEIFYIILGMCIASEDIITTTIAPANKDCGSMQEGQMTVDYNNPQYFFVCIAGTLQRRQCPTNQRFDKNDMVCTAATLTNANAPIELTTIPGVAACSDLPSGAYKRHETDNTKYYVCVLNMLQEEKCPTGFIFHEKEMHCQISGSH